MFARAQSNSAIFAFSICRNSKVSVRGKHECVVRLGTYRQLGSQLVLIQFENVLDAEQFSLFCDIALNAFEVPFTKFR